MRYLYIFLISLISFSSCSRYKDITLSKPTVKGVEIPASLTPIKLKLAVDCVNPTSSRFSLIEASGDFFIEGERVATAELAQEVEVGSKFSGELIVLLNVTLDSPLALLARGFNLSQLKPEQLTADITAKLKSGALKREFKFKALSVDKFL